MNQEEKESIYHGRTDTKFKKVLENTDLLRRLQILLAVLRIRFQRKSEIIAITKQGKIRRVFMRSQTDVNTGIPAGKEMSAINRRGINAESLVGNVSSATSDVRIS